MKKQKFEPNFLVDEHGKRVAVQLSIRAYEALLEEIEDAYDIKHAEHVLAQKGKTHTLEDVEKSLFKRKAKK